MVAATHPRSPSRKDLTGPALRTFFRIAEAWRLKERDQMLLLGLDNRSTFQSWKRGVVTAIPKDALERISYVLGIYKGLKILLPKTADEWVHKPNTGPLFGEVSAGTHDLRQCRGPLHRAPVRGCAARLIVDIPTNRIRWRPCYRIIPSRFPPTTLFEEVADPADLEAVYAVEAMTNDRLREEIGELSLVPAEDRVSGPGSSPIMAAFTHLNPEGDRFTDGTYGVFYASLALETVIAETRYHRTRFMEATGEPAQELDMRVYAVDLEAELHDVRDLRESHPDLYHPTNYGSSQQCASVLRGGGSNGIVYLSVRHVGGECAAVFRPRLVANCRQERHLCYVWDGRGITTVYEKKALD